MMFQTMYVTVRNVSMDLYFDAQFCTILKDFLYICFCCSVLYNGKGIFIHLYFVAMFSKKVFLNIFVFVKYSVFI